MLRPSTGRLTLSLCLALACCAEPPVSLPCAGAPARGAPYRIRPGDELEIRFFHTPGNDVLLPVRPDGCISLPLVHELSVAGRTVDELRLDLLERYRTEFADPELAVIVRTFGACPVHVGGEVGKPGVLKLEGEPNVLDAVVAAGGFLQSADPASIVVVRRGEPTGYELLSADLETLLDGENADGNFALRPYDVVFVPRSPISEVNKWVDLYLRLNIPITFSYRLDPN
jgi:protein involved in polysaccharide export with SLBB domain